MRIIYVDLETHKDIKENLSFKASTIIISYLDYEDCNLTEDEITDELMKNMKIVTSPNLNIFKIIKEFMAIEKTNIIVGFNCDNFDNLFIIESVI